MKNKIKKLLLSSLSLLLIGFPLLPVMSVSADSTSDYQLTIVKYKLSESDVTGSTLPKTPTGSAVGADQAKDSKGENLVPFSGVSYKIEKVMPSNDVANPFELDPNFTAEMISTDSTGQVTVTLPEGIYRVTEQPNSGLAKPATPLIVQLPMTTSQGETLNHVYVYPKSSVVDVTKPSVPTTPPANTIIPHTAGAIQPIRPVYLLLIGLIGVGIFGLIIFEPKKLRK